jgi:hypothetical protein
MTFEEKQEAIAVKLQAMNIAAVSRDTGLQHNTLWNIKRRLGRRARPSTLTQLADYLGVKR